MAAAGVLAALLVGLVIALAGTSGGGGPGRLALSPENRAALHAAAPLWAGLDRLVLGAPLPSPTEQQAAIGQLLSLGLPIFCAGTQKHYLALTFDDGPGPQTLEVMSRLRAAGQRATFFLLGRQLTDFPQLPEVQARSDAIGDHTFSHNDLTRLTPDQVSAELFRTRQLLEQSSGAAVRLFRPPYGARNATTDAAAQQLGLLQVTWNVDTQDAEGATPAEIAQLAEEGMRPGAIILLHDNKPQTLVALPRIFAALRHRGLQSVTIPQLLALNPPPADQVRAGFQGCASAEQTNSQALKPTSAA